MSTPSFRASAPGSLMVLGEYAVLQGGLGLVGAINRRMQVTLIPRPDQTVHLVSALGEHMTDLTSLAPVPPFQFVLAALQLFADRPETGFQLIIESAFPPTMGFSSSAAVTVATLAVVRLFLQDPGSSDTLVKEARTVIRRVQGEGSGADAAACVMGGLVAYRATPFFIEKLSGLFPLTVRYSGAKIPTPQVMAFVREKFADQEKLLDGIVAEIACCAEEGIAAARREDWAALGKLMDRQQTAMTLLGISNDTLDDLVKELRTTEGMLGAKISGAGLGDCVIGLGQAVSSGVSFSSVGLICEAL